MDWKALAIDSLELYRIKQIAIENIPWEIKLIDFDIAKTEEAIENGLPIAAYSLCAVHTERAAISCTAV